jgi:hypothetical protein
LNVKTIHGSLQTSLEVAMNEGVLTYSLIIVTKLYTLHYGLNSSHVTC